MDLKAALGELFDPKAKYELYDSANEDRIGNPGKRVAEIRDVVNNRRLLVFDVSGGPAPAPPKAAPAPAAAPAPRRYAPKAKEE